MKKLNLGNVKSVGWTERVGRIDNGKYMLTVNKNNVSNTFDVIIDDLILGEFYDIAEDEKITSSSLKTINEKLEEFGFELIR
jgi:hypothetical protein